MKRATTTAALVIGLALTGTSMASALTPDVTNDNVTQLELKATSDTSITNLDDLCDQARESDGAKGPCATKTITATSDAQVVKVANLSAADLALTSADGTTLAEAAASGSIYYRTWSQEKRGLYYVNWKEKHTGRYYYNGSRVWSTTRTLGYTGKHVCDQGYGVLYDVKVNKCMTDVISSAKIQEWDYFRVHVVWKGIPLYSSHNMHVTMTRTGTFYS